MKKVFLVPIMIACFTASAFSASIDIGIHGGMAWWKPYFDEWVSGDHALSPVVPTGRKYYSMDPSWQIGADFGIRFTDTIRWRNKYTYSRFIADASFLQNYFFITNIFWKISQKNEKHNLDSIVDYSVHKNISILAGFKYQNYTDKINGLGFTDHPLASTSWKNAYNGVGASAGVGLRYELFKDFSTNLEAKLIYIKPFLKMKRDATINSLPYYLSYSFSPEYNSLGMEADLSFAYFIKQASLTIALGCKYQYLHTMGPDADIPFFNLNRLYLFDLYPTLTERDDHQIDLYLSVAYNFNLPK